VLDEASVFAGEDPLAQCRCILERGRVYNSSGQREKAVPFFERALEKADQANDKRQTTNDKQRAPDFYAVDALHMLAIAARPEDQRKWHQEAIERAENSSHPLTRNWLGSLYNNLGWTLHDAGQFEEALEIFEKALAFRKEQGKDNLIRIAKWTIARCLRSLNRPAEALDMQRELHQQCAATGAPDGYVEEEIAENLLALGRSEESKPHFGRAYELLSQDDWLKSGEPERLERLRELAQADQGS